jgi:hypothetical protein
LALCAPQSTIIDLTAYRNVEPFVWPPFASAQPSAQSPPEERAIAISSAQLSYLLSGIDWRNPVHTFRPQRAG